jgi:hypothetical protein
MRYAGKQPIMKASRALIPLAMFAVSGTRRAGFRARRRTHLPPQMLRVSRQRTADEWPPPG